MSDNKKRKRERPEGELKRYRVFFRGEYDRENAANTVIKATSKDDAVKRIKDAANNDSAYVGVCWAELEEENGR